MGGCTFLPQRRVARVGAAMWLAVGNHHDVAASDESRPHVTIESRLTARNDDDLVVRVMERDATASIGVNQEDVIETSCSSPTNSLAMLLQGRHYLDVYYLSDLLAADAEGVDG